MQVKGSLESIQSLSQLALGLLLLEHADVCVISFQLFKQVEGLAKAESICAPFKDGRKTSQSPSQLASRLLLLEHAECRSALTKPSFSQSQMK